MEAGGLCHIARVPDHADPITLAVERFHGLVILATNRPEELASALDRRVTLKLPFRLPDAAARRRIWAVHLEGLPVDPGVDLEVLARHYPLAGGYIKNAVLAALNLAIARQPKAEPLVTAGDLTQTALLQLRQSDGVAGWRQGVAPRFGVSESALARPEQAALQRLAAMARCCRSADGWAGAQGVAFPGAGLPVPVGGGLKVLIYGDSYAAGLQAAEALAGELGQPMGQVALQRLLSPDGEASSGTRREPRDPGAQLLADKYRGRRSTGTWWATSGPLTG
ncbi:MAG: hypothetical protein AB1505_21575 [Candidatus Latescibacterota bacterium]